MTDPPHPQPLRPALFPGPVLALEAPAGSVSGALAAVELERIRSAVAKRRREFETGRLLARDLLARLGFPDFAIAADPKGAPLWPSGVTGSITHTKGWCAVAVAREGAARSLGLDMEADLRLEQKLWSLILTPREVRAIEALPADQREARAMVVFSAKEALYKCQYPVTGLYLDFLEAEIELRDPGKDGVGEFEIAILKDDVARSLDGGRVAGRYAVGERITAAATLCRPG